MWKSGWKIDKKWIGGKEKWLILLSLGLFLLLFSVPTGWEADSGDSKAAWNPQEGAEGDSESTDVMEVSVKREEKTMENSMDEIRLYEQELENRVKEILKHVEGVGTVDVMIILRSSGEKLIHVDQERSHTSTEEKDSSGGTRTVMTEEIAERALMSGDAGSQAPVIEKEFQPEIAGVVISAQGGGSAQVKAEISEAMEALFGLPAHKIKVLKRVE